MNQILTQEKLGEVGSLHAVGARATSAAVLGLLALCASVSGCTLCTPIPVIPQEPLATAACICGAGGGTNPDWHNNGTLLRGPGLAGCDGRSRLEITRFFLDGMTNESNQTLASVHVADGALTGTIGATFVAATGFQNVHMRGTIGCLDRSSAGVEARVDAVTSKPSTGAAPPYYLYQLSVRNPASSQWDPACPDGAAAIPVAEVWDATGTPHTTAGAFTFSCVNAAIGKCLDYGYLAWAGTDKRDLHLACTRLVRADYCGDGVSYTIDGRPINVWDRVNIQPRGTPVAGATFEAAWDTHGAACYNHHRVDGKEPDCTGTRPLPTGAPSKNGILTCTTDSPLPSALGAPASGLLYDESAAP